MHGPINVKSPNNISKWQMGFNSAFKGLITLFIDMIQTTSRVFQVFTSIQMEDPERDTIFFFAFSILWYASSQRHCRRSDNLKIHLVICDWAYDDIGNNTVSYTTASSYFLLLCSVYSVPWCNARLTGQSSASLKNNSSHPQRLGRPRTPFLHLFGVRHTIAVVKFRAVYGTSCLIGGRRH
jgi:hypothetical protein